MEATQFNITRIRKKVEQRVAALERGASVHLPESGSPDGVPR